METWSDIPGFPNHEVSSIGRVRSWLGPGGYRRDRPRVLKGEWWFLHQYQALRAAIDPNYPYRLWRPLSKYELSEIRAAEGHKPRLLVAREFGVDPERIGAIWDGRET